MRALVPLTPAKRRRRARPSRKSFPATVCRNRVGVGVDDRILHQQPERLRSDRQLYLLRPQPTASCEGTRRDVRANAQPPQPLESWIRWPGGRLWDSPPFISREHPRTPRAGVPGPIAPPRRCAGANKPRAKTSEITSRRKEASGGPNRRLGQSTRFRPVRTGSPTHSTRYDGAASRWRAVNDCGGPRGPSSPKTRYRQLRSVSLASVIEKRDAPSKPRRGAWPRAKGGPLPRASPHPRFDRFTRAPVVPGKGSEVRVLGVSTLLCTLEAERPRWV